MSELLGVILGEKDPNGEIVTKILFYGPKYVIYSTEKTQCRHQMKGDEANKRLATVQHQVSKISAYLTGSLRDNSLIRVQIARAIAEALEDRPAAAGQILDSAFERVLSLRRIEGRLYYFVACFVTALPLLVVGLLAAWHSSANKAFLPEGSEEFILIATSGALGGLLSVLLGIQNLDIDRDTPLRFTAIVGFSRVVIAVFAAIVALFLSRAGLMLGILSEAEQPYGILVLAVLAGFSESLVPNSLRRIESRIETAEDE